MVPLTETPERRASSRIFSRQQTVIFNYQDVGDDGVPGAGVSEVIDSRRKFQLRRIVLDQPFRDWSVLETTGHTATTADHLQLLKFLSWFVTHLQEKNYLLKKVHHCLMHFRFDSYVMSSGT